jgi:hypothetical protein
MRRLDEYTNGKEKWITVVRGSGFYPETLEAAKPRYVPIIKRFGKLVEDSSSAHDLFRAIVKEPASIRVQLMRIFRKYVSPDTPVEMLKHISKSEKIIKDFGGNFRPIGEVKERFKSRPVPDEALVALLKEYEDRGQKGYTLATAFFKWFRGKFGDAYTISGPESGSADIELKTVLEDYKKARPVDFIIRQPLGPALVVGLAHYDSDRGGAQEDDRTGGNNNAANEIMSYANEHGLPLKVLFINDGPGLTLGSMWGDYVALENAWDGRVMVSTLRMLDERLTNEWILS